MKKKIIISIFLFLILFLSKTNSILADCNNKTFFGCDSNHSYACGNGDTCCATQGECGQYPTPTCNGGTCKTSCPPNELNSGTCSGSSLRCCIPPPNSNLPAGGQLVIPSNSGEKCGTNGITTAIGCIPALANDKGVGFMGFVLRWSVGVGGGIAFLLILYGGFMVMTSQANPERVKAGQELITSAVSGLILIILSVFILKIIGVDILGLSAFGFN